MTNEIKNEFISRILTVTGEDKAKFGQMNVSQMICHCADQLRMAFGEIRGLRRQEVDIVKLREMAIKNEPLPAVACLDQIAGEGTRPTELEKDKAILIAYLNRFIETDANYKYSFHPYYGEIDKTDGKNWSFII